MDYEQLQSTMVATRSRAKAVESNAPKRKEPSDDEKVKPTKVAAKNRKVETPKKAAPKKELKKIEKKPLSITIEVSAKKRIALDVESSETIEDVMTKIQEKAGISVEKLRLFHLETKLENGQTIADYQIQQDTTLFLKEVTVIYVIDMVSAKIALDVELSDTIQSVIDRVPKEGRYSEHPHELHIDGRLLDEASSLSDCGVKDGDVLDMNFKHSNGEQFNCSGDDIELL